MTPSYSYQQKHGRDVAVAQLVPWYPFTQTHVYEFKATVELKVVCDDSVSKVSDLERRLENQTNEVLRLTAELESYEYE